MSSGSSHKTYLINPYLSPSLCIPSLVAETVSHQTDGDRDFTTRLYLRPAPPRPRHWPAPRLSSATSVARLLVRFLGRAA